MLKERLEAIGAAIVAQALNAGAAVWAELVYVFTKVWALCRWVARLIKRFVLWLFVPSGTTPIDVLKHCVTVLTFFIGVLALAWSVRQILHPPLVITVADLPQPLKQEYWINPELARTLIGQVERIRNTVKGERDPTFEAVLSPPNIVINTGGWSLNVQEHILTPIGTLLGRGQGEVHLSLTCYHPGCARSTDSECNEPVAPPNPANNNGQKIAAKHHLCLRLTAEIHRGKVYRRLTPRLVLGNDNADLAEPMSRVAEAVTAVSDPATAALYFYRRMREERAATTSFSNVPDVVAELFNEASKAAEQAESNDAVSACWAHSVRAHLAIDRREFQIAEVFLRRARAIPPWRHLWQFTLPVDCDRLITIAEMEFARQLSRRPEEPEFVSDYEDDSAGRRVLAAYERISRIIADFDDSFAALRDLISKSASTRDVQGALELVRSEIGLGFFTQSDQCELIRTKILPASFQFDPDIEGTRETEDATRRKELRSQAWDHIKKAVEEIEKPVDDVLLPLTRQAALDFLKQYALNAGCAANVLELAEKIFVRHANDLNVVQLLVAVTETAALTKTEMLNRPAEDKDRGNKHLDSLRRMYQRIVDTGSDRSGIAINKLAFIAEAIRMDQGEDAERATDTKQIGPAPTTVQNLVRAWRRYQRERYPADTRAQAEYAVAFWGSVLLRGYPEDFHALDQSSVKDFQKQLEKEIGEIGDETLKKEKMAKLHALPAFLTQTSEFQNAFRTLYPDAQTPNLSKLPRLADVGPRIGCMCMLSYVTLQKELADFFILRLNRWQRQTQIELPMCRRDLLPRLQVVIPPEMRRTEWLARLRARGAKRTLDAASNKTAELRQAHANAVRAHEVARKTVQEETSKQRETIRGWITEKQAVIDVAEQLCYMAQKAEAAPAPAAEAAKPAPP